jgi:hypothetical protein
MTDIVERLREYGDFYGANLCIQAADEIERLRGEVESWKHSYKLLDERREQVEAERDAAALALKWVIKNCVYQDVDGLYGSPCDCCAMPIEIPPEYKAAIDAAREEK